jgi:hypothetical protein
MPTRLDTNYPQLTDPNQFESLIRDLCAYEWGDPNTQKFGRKGQKQLGVDVYGKAIDSEGAYRAAQCKLRTQKDALTPQQVETAVSDAMSFPHQLDTLVIATDAPRSTHTQLAVDQLSERAQHDAGFKVVIWFWDNITERLATYPRLIVRYYSDYFAIITRLPIVEGLVDRPLTVLFNGAESSSGALLVQCLKLRGVQITGPHGLSAATPQTAHLGDLSPDGIVCYYRSPLTDSDDSNLLSLASDTRGYEQQVEASCPVFVVLTNGVAERFREYFRRVGGSDKRIQVLTDDLPTNEGADRIFQQMFDFGNNRRGSLTTIDLTARMTPTKTSSALLDMDWSMAFGGNHFPTAAEWEDIFMPALSVVRDAASSLGDRTRIQIDCKLLLPAAFALGFLFNIRIARIGVWARRIGASDFKQQFWLSDGNSANVTYHPDWVRSPKGRARSAIVELTTYVNIHNSVRDFAAGIGLDPDVWVTLPLNGDSDSIAEAVAVAYANQVGQMIRNLNAQGIMNIHLFARIPSALAVLIGQRLQACGQIHLYWFDNPTYRFAFTLK